MAFKLMFIVFIGLLNLRFLFPACLIGYYEDINGTCIVCPPGTLGRNCSEICPNGTYGLKCVSKCTCEDCDPVTGCLSNTTDDTVSREQNFQTTLTVTIVDITTALHSDTPENLVFYIVSSTLGFLLLFTLICCLSKRKKEKPTEPDTVAENVSTGRSDNPSYDYAGNIEDPYSFSNGSEYNTLQFAGLRRYNGANIENASIYGVGQFGSDMPENGEYDMGLTLRTVDEMRQKVIEGERNSPSEMDIYCNDEDNPYMNFRRSEASPYDLAHVS